MATGACLGSSCCAEALRSRRLHKASLPQQVPGRNWCLAVGFDCRKHSRIFTYVLVLFSSTTVKTAWNPSYSAVFLIKFLVVSSQFLPKTSVLKYLILNSHGTWLLTSPLCLYLYYLYVHSGVPVCLESTTEIQGRPVWSKLWMSKNNLFCICILSFWSIRGC